MQLQRVMFLVVLSCLGWMSSARADFTQIVAFGDSLSDTGNVFTASGGTFPPAPYYNGHFSNGPIWLESLAGKLGVPNPSASVTGGTNYSWASAESGSGLSASLGVPNLLTQVSGFTATKTLNPNQLVTIWAGGNDFLNGQTNPFIPADNIAAAITQLAADGGKKFLVPNLPMLDQVPLALTLPAAQQAGLHSLSLAFNSRLKSDLTQLQSSLGVTIYQVDVASLFNNIQANPAHYGFTNVTNSALGDGVPSGNGYLFWDSIHPTSAGHSLIADAAFAQATPEPSTFFLMATAGAGFIAWRRRTRRAQFHSSGENT
jgi:phospholipase/lecithinase/hemolysin